MSAVLQARGISVSFGALRALAGVDLEVRERQLVGLIGPNGAGKTTFIDAITGFVEARGSVLLKGQEISGLAAERRARLGLARTWQTIELFDDLSVRENLAAVSRTPSGSQPRRLRPSISAGSPTPTRVSCHMASKSWSASLVRSRLAPACSCSTSRPRGLTRTRASSLVGGSGASSRRACQPCSSTTT
jgi:ABC-type branched-subunit amino acid transport system ATPase component